MRQEPQWREASNTALRKEVVAALKQQVQT